MAAPVRSSSASGGNLPFLTRPWKRSHIDFVSAGLARGVGDPMSIRRKYCIAFPLWRGHERKRLLAGGKGHHKNICRPGVAPVIENVLAVGRPVGWRLPLVLLV